MAEEKSRFKQHVDDAKRLKEQQARVKQRREREIARFHASITAVAKTKAGADFFIGLFHLAGYNRTSVVTDATTGEVLDGATNYNDARRSVYIDVRKHMDPELRADIEKLAEASEESEKEK